MNCYSYTKDRFTKAGKNCNVHNVDISNCNTNDCYNLRNECVARKQISNCLESINENKDCPHGYKYLAKYESDNKLYCYNHKECAISNNCAKRNNNIVQNTDNKCQKMLFPQDCHIHNNNL